MIKNYILIALRNMRKRKTFALIHILGLSIAFATALLLFLTAMFEFSFDNFHAKKDRVFQVYREQYEVSGTEKGTSMPIPFGPAAKAEIPGIARVSRMGNSGGLARQGNKYLELAVKYVDPDFQQMFSFPLVSGSAASALSRTDEVIVTREFAEKLFGTSDVRGRTIEIKTGDSWKSYEISGVAKNVPRNSSIIFDILARFENFPAYRENIDRWDNQNHPVFVELQDGVSAASFTRSASPFLAKYFRDNIQSMKRDGAKPDANGQYLNLKLIPLDKLHFSGVSGIGSSIKTFFPWMLILLSVVILFIAGSNFVNLSLAASFTRAREIGVRKTFGAHKSQLIIQFWSEAFIICLVSLLLGAGLLLLCLKSYIAATGSNLSPSTLFSGRAIGVGLLVFILTTALAGGYPSLVMSHFNTVRTLQGKLQIGSRHGLRNVLTVIQFFIAVILIISTLIISRQLSYLRNKPLGFNKTEVISIPIGNDIDPEAALQQMRNKLAALPQVQSVTGTDINLGRGLDGSSTTSVMGFDYKNRQIKTNWLRIDYDYLKTLDIPLLEGRDFSRAFATDTSAVLINEKMAKLVGEKDPVGTTLAISGHQMKVIGVVKDFHFKNLHQEIKPLTMAIRPAEWPVSYIFVKVKPDRLPESMKKIQQVWKAVNPQSQVNPSFLDENTEREYKKEETMSNIFTAGAILAIFISCMGLFATALLAMNQRTKEIGVRKVMGASVSGIVALLSKDFARLVAIAFLLGAPVSWFLMSQWLQDFAYHTSIPVWIILAGGVIVLAVALLTVSVHAVRAALANPVKSLRTE